MSSEENPDASPAQKKPIARFATYLLIAIFIIGGIFLFRNIRNIHLQDSCQTRLSALAIAVHEYHDTHKAFPSAAGPIISNDAATVLPVEEGVEPETEAPTDANKWSWRVRLLPYLGEKELYDKFQFDEPWDSEHNLKIAETMPLFFQCPAEKSGTKEINGQAVPVTNYVMITGPKTIGSIDSQVVRVDDVLDGISITLLLVEVAAENRPAWTEPTDITLEELARGINVESGMSVGSRHAVGPGGANVCFADSFTKFIESDYCDDNQVIKHYETKPLSVEFFNDPGELLVILATYDDDFHFHEPDGLREELRREGLMD